MALVENVLLADFDLAPAKVLLFDSQQISRRKTREALAEVGLRAIREASTIRELQLSLNERQHDLLMVASSHADDGIAKLLHGLRHHRFGVDPFAPMVATIGSKDDRLVQSIAFSGVDHIVGKPFSGNQILRRLDALICRRQRFVQTLDYLGPDRRKPGSRDAQDEAIDVPNALRARVDRRADCAPSAAAIAAAKAGLARLRMRNIGRRIGAAIREMRRVDPVEVNRNGWETQFAALCRCLDALADPNDGGGDAVANACAGLRQAALRVRSVDGDGWNQAHDAVMARAKVLLDVLRKAASAR